MSGFFYKKLAAPLIQLARQGVTPDILAVSLALGFCISCFPVIGTTTILCTLIALKWHLSLPAILLANWTALPLQMVFLLPLVHLGGKLFPSKQLASAPTQLASLLSGKPWHVTEQVWTWQWHAVMAWLLLAPLACFLLTWTLRIALPRLAIFSQPLNQPNDQAPVQTFVQPDDLLALEPQAEEDEA